MKTILIIIVFIGLKLYELIIFMPKLIEYILIGVMWTFIFIWFSETRSLYEIGLAVGVMIMILEIILFAIYVFNAYKIDYFFKDNWSKAQSIVNKWGDK